MGKWLDKFLDATQESEAPIPHTLPDIGTVWALSVPPSSNLSEKLPHQDAPPPLPRHCFVTYIDRYGRLHGGWDERATSTVKQCHGTGQACQVELSGGQLIPLRAIRAVGQTNPEGRLIAAWSVRGCGYDGEGTKDC
jgi:hypothetical protein